MRVLDCDEWRTLGQLYAFFGNSLLSPMNRTETVGLDPAFWHDLAGLLGGAIARPAQDCAAWAERAAGDCSRDELVQRVSVEFTHLFVGPPSPGRLRGNRQMGRWDRMLVSARQHIRCASACARLGWRNAVPATSSRIIWESSCCICPSCAGVLRMCKLRCAIRRMRRSRSLSALCASIRFAGLAGFATRWRLRDLTAISCMCSIACVLCLNGRLRNAWLAR